MRGNNKIRKKVRAIGIFRKIVLLHCIIRRGQVRLLGGCPNNRLLPISAVNVLDRLNLTYNLTGAYCAPPHKKKIYVQNEYRSNMRKRLKNLATPYLCELYTSTTRIRNNIFIINDNAHAVTNLKLGNFMYNILCKQTRARRKTLKKKKLKLEI